MFDRIVAAETASFLWAPRAAAVAVGWAAKSRRDAGWGSLAGGDVAPAGQGVSAIGGKGNEVSKTFTKLFSSITESTVWFEDDHTRLVWITMLAMADRNGRVWGSVPGLAARARVPVESCRRALDRLAAPDPDSRTKEFEGRRIESIDGGWRLLNHAKYREIRDAESERERKREWAKKRRAERSKSPGVDADVDGKRLLVDEKRLRPSTVDTSRRNAEAEADAEAESDLSSLRSETQNTHKAGARTRESGSSEPNGVQNGFKRPTVERPRPPAVQASKRPARADQGPATETMSAEAEAILQAMREHEALAEATGRIADKLWGQAFARGVKVEWAIAAVHDAGRKADIQAAAGSPWTWAYCLDRLTVYVGNAKAPRATGSGGGYRRPDEIKQGAWTMSEADRRRVEEQDRAQPEMTKAEFEDLLSTMSPEEAENLRKVIKVAS